MNVTVAKTAGFCFGVNNAVKTAFDTAEKYRGEGKIYTFGPLIHNEAVIEKLREAGVFVLENAEDARAGDVVIIRAHGTTPEEIKKLESAGATVTDATCPFVSKIHRRVKEEYEAGKQIIIIGDREHPEVRGINGWCDNTAVIIGSLEDCEKTVFEQKEYSCVVQTTFNGYLYEKIKKKLQIAIDLIKFYDSICNATFCRQQEAKEIASRSELMIVIGSTKSSNTLRLYEICREVCPNVILVSKADELKDCKVNFQEVGVTAGASTPDFCIEEVLFIMDEVNSIVMTDEAVKAVKAEEAGNESFEDLLESYSIALRSGEVKDVTVSKIEDARVIVDLAYKYEGYIDINEFAKNEDGTPNVNVGDTFKAFVVYVNDKDCEVKLSKEHEDKNKDMLAVEEAFNNKTPLNMTIVKALEHGVIAEYGTVSIYIQASQLGLRFVKNTEKYVGREVTALITRFERAVKGKSKINASVRVILEAEKNAKDEAFWGNIEVGKAYTGIVKSVMPYGAFVELAPGYEGLLHNTGISWKKIKYASEVLQAGQEIEVTVASFDRENNKVSLTAKKAEDDPWYNVDFAEGDILDVTVAKFVPYGVFVQVSDGISALVHISQISNKHIDSAKQCLSEGQQVQAKVISVNTEKKQLNLSIKAVQAFDPAPAPEELDENGNPIVKEPKKNFKRRKPEGEANAEGEKFEKKPRAPKKPKEEEFHDDIVSSGASIGDLVANLGLEFSDEE